jgi:peptide/nickel transport system substrate-binding protein
MKFAAKLAMGLAAVALSHAAPVFAQTTSSNVIIDVVEPQEPKFLDMTTDPGRVAQRVGSMILEPLVASSPKMKLAPGLATSWERVGEKQWRFKLRQGVKFHNGEDFTSEAVKFTIERSKKGNYKAYYLDIERVELPDAYTVDLYTRIPTSVIPAVMSVLWIVPPKLTAEVGDQAFGKAPVGTGPFKFKEWLPGRSYTFVRNDDYWGEKAKIGGIRYVASSEPAARASLLLAGNTDVAVGLGPQEAAEIVASNKAKVAKDITNRTLYIFFDTRAPVVSDPAVRKAIGKLVDRNQIVKALLEGSAAPESRLLIETIFPAAEKVPQRDSTPDPTAARKMLEDAGYGSKFPIEIDFHFTQSRHPMEAEVAEIIIAALEQPGLFKVKRHIRESGAHLSLIFQWKIGGMFLLSGGPTYPHPDVTMRTQVGTNGVVKYCPDPVLDKRIDDALSLTGEAAEQAYFTMERQVLDELACVIPLYRLYDQHGTSNRISGLEIRLNEFIDYQNVTVQGNR